MLTIFTIPKAFKGHSEIIQRNSIQSWKQLSPACEIILCGDDPGVMETAVEFGLRIIPNIECNELGTPLLSSAFREVAKIAQYPLLCYVNADIIFLNDVLDALKRIRFRKFLAVGQRINLDINTALDFTKQTWQINLKTLARSEGVYANVDWIDYFIFPINAGLEVLPPFTVGRPRWDNWFIYNTRKHRVPIIDITRVSTAIHQNHDYSHVPQGRENTWAGPEAEQNHKIYHQALGDDTHVCTILDATHLLTKDHIIPALYSSYLYQRLRTLAALYPRLSPMIGELKVIRKYIKSWLSRER